MYQPAILADVKGVGLGDGEIEHLSSVKVAF
jgi:hypothetical protein